MKCWGNNHNGQVGDGTVTDRHVPTAVFGFTGGAAITAGGFHTCALQGAGTVKCWGINSHAELGDNTTTERHVPTPVSGP